jgi:hypothetical protein
MPRYTTAEQLTRARLFVKGGRAAQAGRSTAGVDNRLDRLEEKAIDRSEREADAAIGQVDRARSQAAAAKIALRTARPADRQTARQAARTADADLRRAERGARKYL